MFSISSGLLRAPRLAWGKVPGAASGSTLWPSLDVERGGKRRMHEQGRTKKEGEGQQKEGGEGKHGGRRNRRNKGMGGGEVPARIGVVGSEAEAGTGTPSVGAEAGAKASTAREREGSAP